MNNVITSQQFLDDETIEAKRAAKDYAVMVSPAFTFDGAEYRVLLDGHHSLAAALADGTEPDVTEATATQHDAVGLLADGNVEDFLAATHMGDDYIFAVSRKAVW